MSSSSDGPGGVAFLLFAAGPATGIAVYQGILAKYRNQKARYMPERVVSYKATNLEVQDAFTGSIVSSLKHVVGRNDTTPDVRAKYTKITKD